MVDQAWFWLILGALLILSEFFITGIIAIFFGIGAILVAAGIALGLLQNLPEQILMFSVLSVGALLFAREKVKVWFRGHVSENWSGDRDLISARGQRVIVSGEFVDGLGRVRLSGSDWTAETEDELSPGDTAWVVGHRGIRLLVSAQRPDSDTADRTAPDTD